MTAHQLCINGATSQDLHMYCALSSSGYSTTCKCLCFFDGASSAYLDLCDQVRDDVLPPLGVRLEDKPEGYIWKLDDPEVLVCAGCQNLHMITDFITCRNI